MRPPRVSSGRRAMVAFRGTGEATGGPLGPPFETEQAAEHGLFKVVCGFTCVRGARSKKESIVERWKTENTMLGTQPARILSGSRNSKQWEFNTVASWFARDTTTATQATAATLTKEQKNH